ncbi:MAG: amidohydrolase family protein [Candidatus Dormibacteraeota bacterium]|nr:amidohydrolase family protein [Candidatus Dormibacteraeota bacterium]
MNAAERLSVSADRTIVKGGLVLDLVESSPDGAVRADILIEGAQIKAVGGAINAGAGDCVIDASDRIVLPGLVNAHLHSWEALFRGRYENLPLELWGLYAYPFLPIEPLPPRLIELRTLLVAIESLKNGVTSVLDDVMQVPGQEIDGLTAVFRAYGQAGIRANVSLRMVDRSWLDTIPFAKELLPAHLWTYATRRVPSTAAYYREVCEAAFSHLHRPAEGVRYVVAPSAPQRCTPALLEESAEMARVHDTAFHIHVLETKLQAVAGKMFFGKTPIAYLDDLGVLSNRATLAHTIWLSERDIEIIALANATVVHNPVSNLKLGSGVFPYAKLHDAGIHIALGTDGVASNDSVRMFDVMKYAALLHTVSDPDFEKWPRALDILSAATRVGARSVALSDIGTIAPGQKADLILLDLNALAFVPMNNLARHLVYCENGSSVRTVLVDGRVVVADGQCTRVNEREVIGEVRDLGAEFLRRHSATEREHSAYEPFFRAIYERCMRESLD